MLSENGITPLMERNNAFAWMIVDYLDSSPKAINAKTLKEADPQGSLPEEMAYAAILSALCDSTEDTEAYFFRSVHRLDPVSFRENPYLKTIRFPDIKGKRWEFIHDSYDPFEAFICDDIEVLPDGTEIPQVGYFPEKISFPSVHENGREWMAVKPSEIRSMEEPLSAMRGNVAVIGLGLGYFAFMASMKPEVESITVVEKESEVIGLFKEHILPQFPFRDKITIVSGDAFDFLKDVEPHFGEKNGFDSIFVDIWHDTADGVGLYQRAKSLEKDGILYRYWLEKSLLSAIRWKDALGE